MLLDGMTKWRPWLMHALITVLLPSEISSLPRRHRRDYEIQRHRLVEPLLRVFRNNVDAS